MQASSRHANLVTIASWILADIVSLAEKSRIRRRTQWCDQHEAPGLEMYIHDSVLFLILSLTDVFS